MIGVTRAWVQASARGTPSTPALSADEGRRIGSTTVLRGGNLFSNRECDYHSSLPLD